MFQAFLIKYGEIGVKGKNRYVFEDALADRIRQVLKDVEAVSYTHLNDPIYKDRIVCVVPKDFKTEHPGYITIEELKKQHFVTQREGCDADVNNVMTKYGLPGGGGSYIVDDMSAISLVMGGYGAVSYTHLEEDLKQGRYNPFTELYKKETFEQDCQQILKMMMAETSKVFEQLPILEDAEILRNILYAGVWTRYGQIRCRRKETKKEA